MIIVHAVQVMDHYRVSAHADVRHDPMGNPCPPTHFYLGAVEFDATGSINADDVALGLSTVLERVDQEVAEAFGGWHNLL